jgi:hypothetical protein
LGTLLLAIASIAILGFEFHGTCDNILYFSDSSVISADLATTSKCSKLLV